MTALIARYLLALAVSVAAQSVDAQPRTADVRVTQRALVVRCLGDTPVAAKTRTWRLPAEPAVLTVSMRNDPRPGVADADPGFAILRFTPEPGHRYDLEVRAEATAFARRVWPRGQWTPVVRDRTTDAIVSGPPEWIATPHCTPQR